MTQFKPSWSPEDKSALREMWHSGIVASVIARKIGKSKCAVCAKARRLGLPFRAGSPKLQAVEAIKVRGLRAIGYSHKQIARLMNKTLSLVAREINSKIDPKPLADLGPNDCRYPIGDPKKDSFGFCGNQAVPDRSYCEFHLALCTIQPPKQQEAA